MFSSTGNIGVSVCGSHSLCITLYFCSLGDGCSFPTCLVNPDPEQPSLPPGRNPSIKRFMPQMNYSFRKILYNNVYIYIYIKYKIYRKIWQSINQWVKTGICSRYHTTNAQLHCEIPYGWYADLSIHALFILPVLENPISFHLNLWESLRADCWITDSQREAKTETSEVTGQLCHISLQNYYETLFSVSWL